MTEDIDLVEADENGNPAGHPPDQRGRVYVGFHQLGGIRLNADEARLSPQEAFVLAGQLNAHATILIQQDYMQQAMAEAALAREVSTLVGPNGESLIR